MKNDKECTAISASEVRAVDEALERTRFEAKFRKDHRYHELERLNDGYVDPRENAQWCGWLAAKRDAVLPAQGAPAEPREKTVFGLDYDGTITRDPGMWFEVMRTMQRRGHEVHIVTMRHECEAREGHQNAGRPAREGMQERFLAEADGVHFTGNAETSDRDAKRPHMDAKGIEVHVWIDDNPKAVHMSAVEIWGWCTQPGDPMVHSAPELATPTTPPISAPGGEPPIPGGWVFNAVRACPDEEDGVWEIGYDNGGEWFAPVVTVNTGLYFQAPDAEPLARAILARLTAPQEQTK